MLNKVLAVEIKKGEWIAIPLFMLEWNQPVLDGWHHADESLATAFFLEMDFTFRQSKDRMVLPHANVIAGMVFGAPLPNYYIAWIHSFAAEFFDA